MSDTVIYFVMVFIVAIAAVGIGSLLARSQQSHQQIYVHRISQRDALIAAKDELIAAQEKRIRQFEEQLKATR